MPDKIKMLYTAQQNAPGSFWSVNVRELGVKGTHENYNVIYNSDCSGHYFNTSQEAFKAAEMMVKKYKEGVKNPQYPNAEKWTTKCDIPEWSKDPVRNENQK